MTARTNEIIDTIIERILERASWAEEEPFYWEVGEDSPENEAAWANHERWNASCGGLGAIVGAPSGKPVDAPEREEPWMGGTIKLRYCLGYEAGTLRAYYDAFTFTGPNFVLTERGVTKGKLADVVAFFTTVTDEDGPVITAAELETA